MKVPLPVIRSVTWAFGPPKYMKVTPGLSFRAKTDMSLGSPLCMKMREALWSAVACYRFRLGQLAGRGGGVSSLMELTPRASSRDQSGSKLPHSKAPAALNSCVFNRGFAYFQSSEGSDFDLFSTRNSRCLATLGMTGGFFHQPAKF